MASPRGSLFAVVLTSLTIGRSESTGARSDSFGVPARSHPSKSLLGLPSAEGCEVALVVSSKNPKSREPGERGRGKLEPADFGRGDRAAAPMIRSSEVVVVPAVVYLCCSEEEEGWVMDADVVVGTGVAIVEPEPAMDGVVPLEDGGGAAPPPEEPSTGAVGSRTGL